MGKLDAKTEKTGKVYFFYINNISNICDMTKIKKISEKTKDDFGLKISHTLSFLTLQNLREEMTKKKVKF